MRFSFLSSFSNLNLLACPFLTICPQHFPPIFSRNPFEIRLWSSRQHYSSQRLTDIFTEQPLWQDISPKIQPHQHVFTPPSFCAGDSAAASLYYERLVVSPWPSQVLADSLYCYSTFPLVLHCLIHLQILFVSLMPKRSVNGGIDISGQHPHSTLGRPQRLSLGRFKIWAR